MSQHTPSTQCPERHWAAVVQAPPTGRSAWHVPSLVRHQPALTQSVFCAHAVAHEVDVPHRYGLQDEVLPAAQAPLPLHVSPVSVAPVQVVPHAVPLLQSAHAPAPSQAPVCPQVVAAAAAQSPSGSAPPPTGPQAPSLPAPFAAAEQAMHTPVQAVSQHTESAQLPLWHSPTRVHVSPSARLGRQVPASQKLPLWQLPSVAQGFAHALPTHRYGAQSVPEGSSPQSPRPLQIRPVTALPTQAVEPQEVPAE